MDILIISFAISALIMLTVSIIRAVKTSKLRKEQEEAKRAEVKFGDNDIKNN